MARKPTCECGVCKRCRNCAARRRLRALRRAELAGAPLRACNGCGAPSRAERCSSCRALDRRATEHPAAVPVDPEAVTYMRELRELAGPGAVVGIGAYGVMIDSPTSRRTWPD